VSEATLAELGADPAARLAALDARVQAWLVDAEGRAVGAYKEDLDAFVEALRADATEPSTDLQALAALHFFATRYGDLADLISALISHCDAAADDDDEDDSDDENGPLTQLLLETENMRDAFYEAAQPDDFAKARDALLAGALRDADGEPVDELGDDCLCTFSCEALFRGDDAPPY
jgi:hypothetical protein